MERVCDQDPRNLNREESARKKHALFGSCFCDNPNAVPDVAMKRVSPSSLAAATEATGEAEANEQPRNKKGRRALNFTDTPPALAIPEEESSLPLRERTASSAARVLAGSWLSLRAANDLQAKGIATEEGVLLGTTAVGLSDHVLAGQMTVRSALAFLTPGGTELRTCVASGYNSNVLIENIPANTHGDPPRTFLLGTAGHEAALRVVAAVQPVAKRPADGFWPIASEAQTQAPPQELQSNPPPFQLALPFCNDPSLAPLPAATWVVVRVRGTDASQAAEAPTWAVLRLLLAASVRSLDDDVDVAAAVSVSTRTLTALQRCCDTPKMRLSLALTAKLLAEFMQRVPAACVDAIGLQVHTVASRGETLWIETTGLLSNDEWLRKMVARAASEYACLEVLPRDTPIDLALSRLVLAPIRVAGPGEEAWCFALPTLDHARFTSTLPAPNDGIETNLACEQECTFRVIEKRQRGDGGSPVDVADDSEFQEQVVVCTEPGLLAVASLKAAIGDLRTSKVRGTTPLAVLGGRTLKVLASRVPLPAVTAIEPLENPTREGRASTSHTFHWKLRFAPREPRAKLPLATNLWRPAKDEDVTLQLTIALVNPVKRGVSLAIKLIQENGAGGGGGVGAAAPLPPPAFGCQLKAPVGDAAPPEHGLWLRLDLLCAAIYELRTTGPRFAALADAIEKAMRTV